MAMNASLIQPARVLADPIDGVPQVVSQKRWVMPMLFASLAATFSGVAVGVRLDVTQQVMQGLQMSGQLSTISDQDLADKLLTAQHLAIVGGVAKGLFVTPILILLVAVLLKFVGWVIAQKALFKRCLSVAAVAFLPVAIFHLVLGISALYQAQISPMAVQGLVPSSLAAIWHPTNPKLMPLAQAVDFFNLWSCALLGLGYAEAAGMRKSRGLMLSGVLYLAYVGVFLVGVPAMMAMGAGGPGK